MFKVLPVFHDYKRFGSDYQKEREQFRGEEKDMYGEYPEYEFPNADGPDSNPPSDGDPDTDKPYMSKKPYTKLSPAAYPIMIGDYKRSGKSVDIEDWSLSSAKCTATTIACNLKT
jgi:hypothetical protein